MLINFILLYKKKLKYQTNNVSFQHKNFYEMTKANNLYL